MIKIREFNCRGPQGVVEELNKSIPAHLFDKGMYFKYTRENQISKILFDSLTLWDNNTSLEPELGQTNLADTTDDYENILFNFVFQALMGYLSDLNLTCIHLSQGNQLDDVADVFEQGIASGF